MQEALRNINSQILSPRDKFFLKKKMKRLSTKKFQIKPKSHRGYGDLLAVKRFNLKLNLRSKFN